MQPERRPTARPAEARQARGRRDHWSLGEAGERSGQAGGPWREWGGAGLGAPHGWGSGHRGDTLAEVRRCREGALPGDPGAEIWSQVNWTTGLLRSPRAHFPSLPCVSVGIPLVAPADHY